MPYNAFYGIGDAYSSFVVMNESGEKTVLFDVFTQYNLSQILFLAFVIGFFSLVFYGIYKKQQKTECPS